MKFVWPILLGISSCFLVGAGAAGPAASEAESPIELIQDAFDRMFNYPSVRTIELHIERNGRRVSYRRFDVAYRKLEGRGHTILRFTGPEYLRGNAFLVIEDRGRSDAWLYQPDQQLLRRIGTQQKGDPFYGSDLTFEDLEHHDWKRFRLETLAEVLYDGKSCYAISATPPADSQYGRVVVYIEKARKAVLRIDFFRRGGSAPFKQMLIPSGEIEELHGNLVPRQVEIVQRGRDAKTHLEMTKIIVDPELTKHEFSVLRLRKTGEDLFELAQRRLSDSAQESR